MSGGRLTPDVGANDHVIGPEDAPVTLVEYGDYECPSCGMAHPIVKSIRGRLADQLRFVFRPFPLSQAHPHAAHAAQAAEAAAAQGKFWQMHDILFENQDRLTDADLVRYADALDLDTDLFAKELEEETYEAQVRASFRSGVRSGVNGTPTFFINGERHDGPWADEGYFLRAIRAAASNSERR